MEKEHKSKNKVHKVKKEIVVEKKESPVVEKTPTNDVKLGTFPKPKVKDTAEKTRVVVPLYLLIAAFFVLAFVVGAVFAKVIPNINFNFANKPQNQVTHDVVKEATKSADVEEAAEKVTAPVLKTKTPEIAARAYGIFKLNNKTGEYDLIANKNPELTLPMASVTKVMTAVVAMGQYDLDKPVVVPQKCVALNGSSVGFRANDVLSLQDMLYGLLVKSGADAACAIANIDNEIDFISQMNKRAIELGMVNTQFTNAIGFDNGVNHVSNVDDLKILVSHALEFSSFRKIVGTEEITLTSKSNGASYKIHNTNDLLFSIPGTVGIKTGYTDSAGECLAYLYQNKSDEILIIILGSADRFGDTSKLLEWAKGEIDLNSL